MLMLVDSSVRNFGIGVVDNRISLIIIFGKMLLKVTLLGFTFFYLIQRYAASFAHLPHAGLEAGIAVCAQMTRWLLSILLGTTGVFAVADYAMQHRQLRKQLMMSREDIKQEFKNSEGSP